MFFIAFLLFLFDFFGVCFLCVVLFLRVFFGN